MKTSAIVRIVIFSFVAILLVGILLAGIGRTLFTGRLAAVEQFGRGGGGSETNSATRYRDYADAAYIIGGGSYYAKAIGSIDIDWLEGGVTIARHDKDTVEFSETAGVVLESDYIMRHHLNDGVLNIRWAKSRANVFGLFNQRFDKALTVYVPENIYFDLVSVSSVSAKQDVEVSAGHLRLESVSGRIDIGNVTGDHISVDTVSGRFEGNNISGDSLKIGSVSGGINIENVAVNSIGVSTVSGRFEGNNISGDSFSADTISGGVEIRDGEISLFTAETVSGHIKAELKTLPKNSNIETMSGGVTLTLPENEGFTAYLSRVSGNFSCDFAVEMRGRNTAVYKDGGADINISTVSGAIRIERG